MSDKKSTSFGNNSLINCITNDGVYEVGTMDCYARYNYHIPFQPYQYQEVDWY